MRPKCVVVPPPVFNQKARLSQRAEEMLVRAFVPKPADEAFHKGILRRLAWRDVMPVDPGFLPPLENRMAGRLGAVVRTIRMGLPRQRDETSRSNSRATRTPYSEKSGTMARASREKSSTMHKARNFRPTARLSVTKSTLQCSLGRGRHNPRLPDP